MSMRASRVAFAAAMIGMGIVTLVCGHSVEWWQPIPKAMPGRDLVIYLCAAVLIATGVGLLLRASVALACRFLLPFLLLWLVLLKLPGLLLHPQVIVRWESFGETLALSAGAWCLFAAYARGSAPGRLRFAVDESGIRIARLLLIAALPMFGLAHFAYADLTASLVPKWMHFPLGWTYLTGAASLAAAAGMLFSIYPRLAANLEAVMLWIFTLFVWVPRVIASPKDQDTVAEFFLSWAIAAAAWLVADTYRKVPWLASGRAARSIAVD
jgi:uncharacterized membrane protein